MARKHRQAAVARLLAGLLVCTVFTTAADKPARNQAENRRLKLEATAITDPKLVAKEVGVLLGAGYIVVKLRATPMGVDPLLVTPDDFTLVSRKNGEKSGALPPDGFVDPKITEALKKSVFTGGEGKEPMEGLLYFQMENKLKPSQLGMIYVGKAGRLIVDFK